MASLVAQLVKNPPAMRETGLGRSPGEGKGYPLQYSGLENSMYSPWSRKESTEQLSLSLCILLGFPGGSVVKNLPANAGDTGDVGSILGSGRSPGGNGNPLHYSCLENPIDRGAW